MAKVSGTISYRRFVYMQGIIISFGNILLWIELEGNSHYWLRYVRRLWLHGFINPVRVFLALFLQLSKSEQLLGNYRMDEDWSNLWRSFGPAQARIPRAGWPRLYKYVFFTYIYILFFKISKDGHTCISSLGNLFQCSVILTLKKKKNLNFQGDLPVLQCVPIASCPVIGHHSDIIFLSHWCLLST